MTDLFNGRPKKLLHVAPEPAFEKHFRRQIATGYLTADLHNPRAMITMDITGIPFPADYFDVVYCSHVLEHVPDDRRAMHEIHRVLKPGGWAILLVPITGECTLEDPAVTDPAERLRLFGKEDHVRRYGLDYLNRLREAGFNVRTTAASDFLSIDEIVLMGITDESGSIFHCTKQ